MISLLKYVNGPWERVRGYLSEDLDTIQTAVNQLWSSAFSNDKLKSAAILGNGTPATRYVANTGPANAPKWEQVDLTNGVKNRLPFSHLVAATHASVVAGRESGSAGDYEEITLGSGLSIAGTVLKVSPSSIIGSLPLGVASGREGDRGTRGPVGSTGVPGTPGLMGMRGRDGEDGVSRWWPPHVREGLLSPVAVSAAPATSIGVGIVNYYGTSATNFLGDPNAWLQVNVLGVPYKIPLYT